MIHLKPFISIAFLLLLAACSTQTEPINYGTDACTFCKMTIMDKKYAGEVVSKKGKNFKFDDVSCLIKYVKVNQLTDDETAIIVVNNFNKPHDFLEAKNAVFVQDSNINSPMGGNFAAFASLESVDKSLVSVKNQYSWADIFTQFKP